MNGRCYGLGYALSVFLLASSTDAREPFYLGAVSYKREVSTGSLLAQRYFNQGLAWLHGFNHSAAMRSFNEAAKLDPECAMAHWGKALAAGPHLNNMGVPPGMFDLAIQELVLARRAKHASVTERALVDALSRRYPRSQSEPRRLLHSAYADAMREVWRQHPQDPDVGSFFAESLMNLRPFDYWTPEGQPNPGTEEIVATLDSVLRLDPKHPFANHLYIHALEASPHPEQADAASECLRNLQPQGAHMLHMPSHIDVRRGRWHEAILANTRAIKADERYRARFGGKPLDLLAVYTSHNRNMLAYAALMTGQGDLALRAARQLIADLPPEFIKDNASFADGLVAIPLEILMRFGKWDEILAEADNYPEYLLFSRAFHHAARAVAFAAKGDPQNARKEQTLFVEHSLAVPESTGIGNNGAVTILALIRYALEGEILVAEGSVDDALRHLQEALKLEDSLRYDEPPSWMIPLRHVIGAILMNAGRAFEAEQVYRDDLSRLPDNGWSLHGLSEALKRQNKNSEENRLLERRFQNIWAKADVKITSSCLCQPGKLISEQ